MSTADLAQWLGARFMFSHPPCLEAASREGLVRPEAVLDAEGGWAPRRAERAPPAQGWCLSGRAPKKEAGLMMGANESRRPTKDTGCRERLCSPPNFVSWRP